MQIFRFCFATKPSVDKQHGQPSNVKVKILRNENNTVSETFFQICCQNL